MKYRNEWKYIVDVSEIATIENKLSKVLPLDVHTLDGIYTIHSLYFDDFKNSCMYDNDAGLNKRYKWRIRYYNNDTSRISLEKKEKLKGMCRKQSCLITLEQFNLIMQNRISELFWNTDNEVLKLFCIEIMNRRFEPKVIIDYERTAYVETISNVRITFDKNISASKEIDRFLDGTYTRHPLQQKNKHVLEIKFDDILPSHIKQAAYLNNIKQTTFSKYYLSRHMLERA